MQKPAKGLALVAVGFDAQTEALVATAVSLARRFDLELRFMHVVPSQATLTALDYSESFYSYPSNLTLNAALLIKEATLKMEELLAKLPADVQRSSNICEGGAIPLITAEVLTRRANLILTACDPEGYSAMTQGFSTAVGLMDQAQVPVLAVSRAAPIDFSRHDLRLFLADDLQDSTSEAAAKAYELACRLGAGTSVRHVNIHGDLRELLRASLTEARLRTVAAHPETELQAAMERDNEARVARLEARGEEWRAKAKAAGVHISGEIRTGHVQNELHAATSAFKPDLMVFGRHRLLRARPFLIGRMPFRAMLADKLPVLLVPSRQELYAQVAFPGNT